MKIKLIIITLAVILTSVYAEPKKNGRPPGRANIKLEQLDFYKPNWSVIRDLIGDLLAIGYMDIQINDFEYRYYCTHCEGIGYQGSDPLVLDPDNLEPIYEWCERNKGKFAEVSFWDLVEFNVVTEVVTILNEQGLKFSLSDADRTEKIKIDLLDGRPKVRKTNEPNQNTHSITASGGSE